MRGRNCVVRYAAGITIVVACGGGRDDQPTSGFSTASITAAETTGGETDGTTSGDDQKLDVAAETATDSAGDAGQDEGCIGVDILFVIDNSQSMADDQMELAAAFPLFVDEMFAALPPDGVSLHVGVTTSSGLWSGPNSENTFECVSDYSAQELADGYWPPQAGQTYVPGEKGTLYEHDGVRYFAVDTDQDPAPLKAWFSAAALRGENGTNVEMIAAATGWAADPVNADVNAGFMRDEGAVLVIFVITDEPDKSPEPIDPYVQQVLGAKSACGGADCIVTAGIVPQYCYDHQGDTTLQDFLHAFGKPPAAVGTIAESFIDPQPPPTDYSEVLGNALAEVIATACEDIPTPG